MTMQLTEIKRAKQLKYTFLSKCIEDRRTATSLNELQQGTQLHACNNSTTCSQVHYQNKTVFTQQSEMQCTVRGTIHAC